MIREFVNLGWDIVILTALWIVGFAYAMIEEVIIPYFEDGPES